MWVPRAAAVISFVDDLSIHLVTEMSWKLALPAPEPPPTWVVPDCETPQLHARTSISPLCLASCASPSIPLILRNMSTAMVLLLLNGGLGPPC